MFNENVRYFWKCWLNSLLFKAYLKANKPKFVALKKLSFSKFHWSKKCPFFWASTWWEPSQQKFGTLNTFFHWGFPFFTSLLKTPEPWPLHYYSWIIRDKPDHRVIRMRNMFSEKKSQNVLVIKFIYYLLTLQILLISTFPNK